MEPVLLEQDKIVRAGVAVFVFKGPEFLMLKRQGSHGAGTWCLPGGWMDFGELPEEAARREVLEETGISIKYPGVVGYTNDVFPDDGKHGLTLFIRSVWAEGEPVIMEPNKASDMAWFSFSSLPRGPFFMPFTKFLRSGMLRSMSNFANRDYPVGEMNGSFVGGS